MTIQRIGLNSALRVGAIMGFILGFITGLPLMAFQGFLTTIFINLSINASPGVSLDPGMVNSFTLMNQCIFYGLYILFSTISGGVTGLLLAFAYNLAARWVGGLELELDRDYGKRSDEIYD